MNTCKKWSIYYENWLGMIRPMYGTRFPMFIYSFRHYLVQVQTFNQQGSSAPSAPVFVYVGYSIPKQNVSDFSAKSMSSTSIALRWSSWKDPDDVISGFKIRYGPMDTVGAQPELEEIVSAEKTTFTLIELRKYTKYYVSASLG